MIEKCCSKKNIEDHIRLIENVFKIFRKKHLPVKGRIIKFNCETAKTYTESINLGKKAAKS